jgi:hypothetical protein
LPAGPPRRNRRHCVRLETGRTVIRFAAIRRTCPRDRLDPEWQFHTADGINNLPLGDTTVCPRSPEGCVSIPVSIEGGHGTAPRPCHHLHGKGVVAGTRLTQLADCPVPVLFQPGLQPRVVDLDGRLDELAARLLSSCTPPGGCGFTTLAACRWPTLTLAPWCRLACAFVARQ